MVCRKLSKGACRILNQVCSKPYQIKMIEFKSCPVFKKAKLSKKVKRTKVVRRKTVKRRKR